MELRSNRAEDIGESATREFSSLSASAVQQYPTLLRESTEKKRTKTYLSRAYEGFLTLPVPAVHAVLWLGGVALMSACGVALYLLWLSLQAL